MKTYWSPEKGQQDHTDACEICTTTSFQHPHFSKTPLLREIANKMGTKEILRDPSIQPPDKAKAKPPMAPLPQQTGRPQAGGRGQLESPLLNKALKRGHLFTGCSPWGLGIVLPFLPNTHVINGGLTQHWA